MALFYNLSFRLIMSIWALADLHLALGTPSKDMRFFGPTWENYTQKIYDHWHALVKPEDLVLIPGDISWAMTLAEAEKDLLWLDSLPGQKLLLRGNHDYWWASQAKMTKALPPTLHFLHHNAWNWEDVTIGGTRLWDSPEYTFKEWTIIQDNPKAKKAYGGELTAEDHKLFAKELERLRMSLRCLNPQARLRIALTHYPPIGADLAPSSVSAILEEFRIDLCIFGHLHSLRPGSLPFGEARGVKYIFTSADYVDFTPLLIDK